MVRELIHDPIFLAQKSKPATKEDFADARDLLDTLAAHRETCVGMAANMIGAAKRIIAFDNGGSLMVMLNPEIVKQSGEYETEESCRACWAAPGKQNGFKKSRSAIKQRICRSDSRPLKAGRRRSSSMRWITATAF